MIKPYIGRAFMFNAIRGSQYNQNSNTAYGANPDAAVGHLAYIRTSGHQVCVVFSARKTNHEHSEIRHDRNFVSVSPSIPRKSHERTLHAAEDETVGCQ